jgi:hypothetical protein
MRQVVCHKCRCPNQFGAVFCRNCGEKLKVQDLEHPDRFNFKGIKKIIIRLVKFCIGIAVVLLIAALFVPWGLPEYPTLTDEKEIQATKKKCHQIDRIIAKGKGGVLFNFTPQQATYAANYLVSDRPPVRVAQGGGTSAPTNPFDQRQDNRHLSSVQSSKPAAPAAPQMTRAEKERLKKKKEDEAEKAPPAVTATYAFNVDEKLRLKMVVKGWLWQYIPYRFELTAVPKTGEPDKKTGKPAFDLEIVGAKFGHLPLPMSDAVKKHIIDFYKYLAFANEKTKNYITKVKLIVIEQQDMINVSIGK